MCFNINVSSKLNYKDLKSTGSAIVCFEHFKKKSADEISRNRAVHGRFYRNRKICEATAADSAQSLGTSAVFFPRIRAIARIDWEARMVARFGKTCELTARCLYNAVRGN